jgi:hypothetical protein
MTHPAASAPQTLEVIVEDTKRDTRKIVAN